MSAYNDSGGAGWQDSPRRGPRRRPGRSASLGHSHAILASKVLAGVVAFALVGGSLFAYAKYRSLWDSLRKVDVSADLTGKRPPVDPHALNLLVLGSDSRKGKNGRIGGHVGIVGQRSDTIMVVHIAPGARRAVVLSFPRDSVVPVLHCSREAGFPGQTAVPGQVEQINATFSNGGPGCTWKTIEHTTHIRVSDFLELTFAGFEKVINNLGGVNVCLPAKVAVPQSGLYLSKGMHHVWGREALAFWRTRESVGEGSDLQRIQRDQFLMASLIQGIEHKGLLTSITKMASVVGVAARNMFTNITSVTTMLSIAESVRHIPAKRVQFIQIPTQTYSGNQNWVQWTPQAAQLFSAIAHDTKLPKVHKGGKKPVHAKLVVATPDTVNVQVLNGGSAVSPLASQGSADLTAKGFNVVGSGNAPNFNYGKSVIEYHGPRDLPAVRALKQELDNVETLRVPSVPRGTISLILGSTFTALKTPGSKKASTGNLTKTFGGVKGNVNVCKDKSAFSGPDGP
jgi:LCP family protein required for cell wall assembly